MEISIMQRRHTMSRAQQRQAMLQELAADGAPSFTAGQGYSRAVEAVDALQRIRDGTYGSCSECGKRIPAARLQVKPEAKRCVACQTNFERRFAAGSVEWCDDARRSA